MSRAYVIVREAPSYRRDAFTGGLKRAGFEVLLRRPERAQSGDVMVVWNRYGENHSLASTFEKQGGTVLVAENGYLGADAGGIQLYALAVHGHNGSGWWPAGEERRFEKLGVDVKPWRTLGEHIYVRGQRGIGAPAMASPPDWHNTTQALLRKYTSRRIAVVEHPGKPACDPAQAQRIAAALERAHACVIWSSATGVRALVEGIPVFYSAPHWVCAGAAKRGIGEIENPLMDDAARARALERMAWAQWTVAELGSGEPFLRLMDCDRAQRGLERAEEVRAP